MYGQLINYFSYFLNVAVKLYFFWRRYAVKAFKNLEAADADRRRSSAGGNSRPFER